MMLGHYMQIIVRVSDDQVIKVFLPKEQTNGFRVGMQVTYANRKQQQLFQNSAN